jgi:hypothetical protein
MSTPRVSDERLNNLLVYLDSPERQGYPTPLSEFQAIVQDALDARRERVEIEKLHNRMSELLTNTAGALKGKPGPLTMHSWSDLPQCAALIVANETRLLRELALMRPIVEAAEAWEFHRESRCQASFEPCEVCWQTHKALVAAVDAYRAASAEREGA